MSIVVTNKMALLIANAQIDFSDGVPESVIHRITDSAYKFPVRQRFSIVDEYSEDHKGFSNYPRHCIAGTNGRELVDEIAIIRFVMHWVNKCEGEMIAGNAFQNGKGVKTDFAQILRMNGYKSIALCGFTGAVLDTALQALDAGFEVFVIEDATCTRNYNRVWGKQDYKYEKSELSRVGVKFINSNDLVVEA